MTTRTEGFRLVSLLIVIALCAIGLFTAFHALATTPQARTEQSGIVLDAVQSTADTPQSAPAVSAQPHQPAAPEPAPPTQPDIALNPTPAAPEPPVASTPAPVVVPPAPPLDLDDDIDDDNDNDDVDDEIDD